MAAVEQLRFAVEGGREVSALLWRPAKSRRLLVLAHGAGAGMSHPFMEKLAGELAGVGVATLWLAWAWQRCDTSFRTWSNGEGSLTRLRC